MPTPLILWLTLFANEQPIAPTVEANSVGLEFAKQIPSLFVLVLLVVMFLRHLVQLNKSRDDSQEANIKAMEKIAQTCHDSQLTISSRTELLSNRMVASLDRSTEVMGRAVSVIERNEPRQRRQQPNPPTTT